MLPIIITFLTVLVEVGAFQAGIDQDATRCCTHPSSALCAEPRHAGRSLAVAAVAALTAAAPHLISGVSSAQASTTSLAIEAASISVPQALQTGGSGYTFLPPRRQSTYQRVASTPVFAVTSPGGQPYLHTDPYRPGISLPEEANGGTTEALYFMDIDDAHQHMTELQQQKEGIDVRVTASSMEHVLKKASVREGLPSGQMMGDLMQTVHYRIVPSRRMAYEAGRIDPSFQGGARVPVFAAAGLGNRGGRGTPLFYSMDDLHEAWDTMRGGRKLTEEQRAAIPEQPDVMVFDALAILTKIEEKKAVEKSGGEFQGLEGIENVQLIPMMSGVRWAKLATAVGDGKARL